MKPTTVDELKALPIGPEFGTTQKVIDGKTYTVPVPRPTQATWFADDDLKGYADETGSWSIGQYADGGWFRRRIAG
ncbi:MULTISPECIES: hypothetical protein [Mesorhizobium]|uniref:hypothetical protein n=1 Tax=Mesorhizobium TaxID=68287 RepID=UPI0010A9739B|nr:MULTISPECIES: hypothetical protein [Mesorhizobium]